jgi:hypothetical protein
MFDEEGYEEEHRLQARNHEVVFLYSPGAAGLPFVPGDQTDWFRAHIREVSKLHGESALDISMQDLMNQTEAILKSLPEMITATGVDALVIDTAQLYAELGPMQLGMPYIQVSNMLHFDYSGYTPSLSVWLAPRNYPGGPGQKPGRRREDCRNAGPSQHRDQGLGGEGRT